MKVTKEQKKKPVIQVLSALPIGFDGKAKSGGVAPGILNAIPVDYEMVRWVGIMKSGGDEKDNKIEAALKAYGVNNGIDQKDGLTQTFQNHYVEPNLYDQFYVNATNGTIWPLIHSMPEKRSREARFESLESINSEYSKKLLIIMKGILKERNKGLSDNEKETFDDLTIWAHDYHVFHVPGMIKEQAKELTENPNSDIKGIPKVSFFHHEPWPAISPGKMNNDGAGVDSETGLVYANFTPKEKTAFKKILANLVKADTIGFHTKADADNFVKTVKNFDVLEQKELKELKNRVFVNPIGVPKASIKQNFLLRAPFLKEGLASDTIFNQQFNDKQPISHNESHESTQNSVTSDVLESIHEMAIDYRDNQRKVVKKFRTKVSELRKKENKTPNEKQLIATEAATVSRMMNGKASFYDQMTVSEQFYFDPKQTHIVSVQRFDYTKGIEEFLNGYEIFLKNLKEKGVENPGELFQFNLITGKGRSGGEVQEYTNYETKCKSLIKKINNEFPGAIYHYNDGIPNPELPMTNAASDIVLVSSVADGYVLAGPEILESHIASLEEGMQTNDNYNPQLIISNKVGLARNLETIEGLPERLQLVDPNPESFAKALMIAYENREKGIGEGLDAVKSELNQISNAIPDSMGTFGPIAFATMEGKPVKARETAKNLSIEHQKIRNEEYFQPKEIRDEERESAKEVEEESEEKEAKAIASQEHTAENQLTYLQAVQATKTLVNPNTTQKAKNVSRTSDDKKITELAAFPSQRHDLFRKQGTASRQQRNVRSRKTTSKKKP